MRLKLDIPRGERYELCRSVHAEMNAVIHASRADMLGSTMYLVGRDMVSGEYVDNAAPCPLCKRVIINSGISNVIVRDDQVAFRNIVVLDEWVSNDDTLELEMGY
jgi:dCMP deaminase